MPITVNFSQLSTALDKTLDDLAHDFRGDGAFSFATEADVQSTLLGRLRANVLFNVRVRGSKVELVHAEFPAFGTSWKGGPRHDLVVWRPELAEEAHNKWWGKHPRRWPEALRQKLNLVAIEIERFPGLPWDIRKRQMLSNMAQSVLDEKVWKHPDVRKLRESWCESAYFVIFWDENVQRKPELKVCFESMHNACSRLAKQDPKLRFFCTCKDGSIFNLG